MVRGAVGNAWPEKMGRITLVTIAVTDVNQKW